MNFNEVDFINNHVENYSGIVIFRKRKEAVYLMMEKVNRNKL